MKGTLIALATAGVLVSGTAFADTTTFQGDAFRTASIVPVQYYQRGDDRSANINEREARINSWIERGVSDGRITDWEARRHHRELGDIQARERAFMSDGRLDGYEYSELNRDLDRLADNVRDRMRNDNRRY